MTIAATAETTTTRRRRSTPPLPPPSLPRPPPGTTDGGRHAEDRRERVQDLKAQDEERRHDDLTTCSFSYSHGIAEISVVGTMFRYISVA